MGFNNVFGYYIEVTNTHRDRVPADYIRKQTLTGAERYVTPALKEQEEKILHAEERLVRVQMASQRSVAEHVAVVTGDGDFGNLLRFPLGSHFGFVIIDYPSAMRTRELATQIADALCDLDDTTFHGSLVILEPGRARIKRAT